MSRNPKKIVLLGGSAGGIEAIGAVLKALPADIDAAVFVVIHLNPSVPSMLAQVLDRRTALNVVHAQDGEEIRSGTVYVAPPDRHLMIHEGQVKLGRGPRENNFRPAVDPLFRSAAMHFRENVIGVVLSGNLDDGTTGLIEIKRQGGIAMVQDPADAPYAGMPASALQEVPGIDYVLPAAAIGEQIIMLIHQAGTPSLSIVREVEPDIAMGGRSSMIIDERQDGQPAGMGCPDCGGSLWEYKDGTLARYRCRVGHAYSDEALLGAQTETLERALWTALRALEEAREQANRIAQRMDQRGNSALAGRFRRQGEDADARAEIIRKALMLNQNNNEQMQTAD